LCEHTLPHTGTAFKTIFNPFADFMPGKDQVSCSFMPRMARMAGQGQADSKLDFGLAGKWLS